MLEYACVIWHPGLTKYLSSDLENIQKRALCVIFPDCSYETALQKLDLCTLDERRTEACLNFFDSMQDPHHKLHHLLPETRHPKYNLRHHTKYTITKNKTARLTNKLVSVQVSITVF